MTGCHSNRYNLYGYLDLAILSEYAEYANSLCEFVLNSIVLDYVVRVSIKNYKNLIPKIPSTNSACISLYNINLDTDFISYGERMRRICAMSKSTMYDIKTTRLRHPTWIVRFSPNFKRILRIFACNLRNLIKKISEIENHISKTDLNGEIIRYHAISTALTTVKYDLLTLYVTIRSGGLTAMKTSFLYPILNDTQRWLTYSYYQIKQILSSFPGSNVNRHLNRTLQTKTCIPSIYLMNKKLKKTIQQSEISFNESQIEQLSIN
ncbi:unnamed protein product [Adineta steineri]|uniref:Uncharacterized protein n=1 Tax=Adineta steineri TaxID=433720 RepID=A0A813YJW6_9BILA|nr:unnamed protein product [Adineta steineri]CAF0885441.1 unnamed protein product [Adineta steineri]